MKPFSLKSSLRPHLQTVRPYSSARHEFSGKASIYLDANENPFQGKFNRYPDPNQQDLKSILAKRKGVEENRIFIGNGSDEAIDLLIRAFCEPGIDHIITTPPTYGMYKVCAAINNVGNLEIPLDSNFNPSVQEILKAVNEHTKIIFLCSPNNPTGNSISAEILKALLEKSGILVVVDEAYIDFSEKESSINLKGYPNLVVLQTLSKAYGLAGLRIGLAIGQDEIISVLNRIKPPYNISSASQEEAIKILKTGKQTDHTSKIIREREKLINDLASVSTVRKIFPSEANFLLVRFDDPKAIYQYLKRNGIIVRDRSEEINCTGCLRITVGTPEENQELISTLKSYQPITV